MGKLVFVAILLFAGYFLWMIVSQTAGVRSCYEANANRYEEMEMKKVRYGTTPQQECEATYDAVMTLGSCLRLATTSAQPVVAKSEIAAFAYEMVRLIRPGLRTIMSYTRDHNDACGTYDYYIIP